MRTELLKLVFSRLRTISQSYFRESFGPWGATQHVFKGSPTSFEEIGALIFTIHSYKYPITKLQGRRLSKFC